MAFLTLLNCSLNLPVYGAGNRSLKQMVLSAATGGRIAADSRKLTVVEALQRQPGHSRGRPDHPGRPQRRRQDDIAPFAGGHLRAKCESFRTEGRVTSLLDLTLGLDYEATGYKNIVLRGLILGASKADMLRLTPAVAEFSELGDYLDMPTATYSSGMVLRLAFAIVTSVHADILLMDEWLSVGDAAFVKKAEGHMMEFVGKADILVLASHNAKIIDDLCNVIVEMEHGTVKSVPGV